MRLPRFPSRKNSQEQLSKQDEQVFAEASELARLRLEQCVADLRIWLPAMRENPKRRNGSQQQRLTNLF